MEDIGAVADIPLPGEEIPKIKEPHQMEVDSSVVKNDTEKELTSVAGEKKIEISETPIKNNVQSAEVDSIVCTETDVIVCEAENVEISEIDNQQETIITEENYTIDETLEPSEKNGNQVIVQSQENIREDVEEIVETDKKGTEDVILSTEIDESEEKSNENNMLKEKSVLKTTDNVIEINDDSINNENVNSVEEIVITSEENIVSAPEEKVMLSVNVNEAEETVILECESEQNPEQNVTSENDVSNITTHKDDSAQEEEKVVEKDMSEVDKNYSPASPDNLSLTPERNESTPINILSTPESVFTTPESLTTTPSVTTPETLSSNSTSLSESPQKVACPEGVVLIDEISISSDEKNDEEFLSNKELNKATEIVEEIETEMVTDSIEEQPEVVNLTEDDESLHDIEAKLASMEGNDHVSENAASVNNVSELTPSSKNVEESMDVVEDVNVVEEKENLVDAGKAETKKDERKVKEKSPELKESVDKEVKNIKETEKPDEVTKDELKSEGSLNEKNNSMEEEEEMIIIEGIEEMTVEEYKNSSTTESNKVPDVLIVETDENMESEPSDADKVSFEIIDDASTTGSKTEENPSEVIVEEPEDVSVTTVESSEILIDFEISHEEPNKSKDQLEQKDDNQLVADDEPEPETNIQIVEEKVPSNDQVIILDDSPKKNDLQKEVSEIINASGSKIIVDGQVLTIVQGDETDLNSSKEDDELQTVYIIQDITDEKSAQGGTPEKQQIIIESDIVVTKAEKPADDTKPDEIVSKENIPKKENGSDKVKIKSEGTQKSSDSSPGDDSSKRQIKRKATRVSPRNRPEYQVPCHLLGRNVDNPTEDLISNGRTPPKPRLGVKVPYRFLTSQIVSKQDIANEVLERVAKRNPEPDPPTGVDIFFASKLTQRLASKIVSKQLAGSAPSAAPRPAEKQPTEKSQKAIGDNSDLLALLEGEVDVDWTKEVQPRETSRKTSESDIGIEKAVRNTTAGVKRVLDPETERMLALKQLQQLPKPDKRKRTRKPIHYYRDMTRRISTRQLSVKKVRSEIQRDAIISEPGPSRAKQPIEKKPVEKKPVESKTTADILKGISKDVKQAAATIMEKIKGKQLEDAVQKAKIQDEINEPILNPKKVTKTYSRKEAVLDVPADLEYIVNEAEANEALNEANKALNEANKQGAEAEGGDRGEVQIVVDEKSKNMKLEFTKDTPTAEPSQKQVIVVNVEVHKSDDAVVEEKRSEQPEKKPEKKSAGHAARKAKRSLSDINKPQVTLVSKRARVIKQKVIWDPAEVTVVRTPPTVKKPKPAESPEKTAKTKSPTKKTSEKASPQKSENEIQSVEEVEEKKDEPKASKKPKPAKVGRPITRSRILPKRLNKIKKSKKILISRKLKTLASRLLRSSKGDLQKTLALAKKKSITEIKKTAKTKRTELDKLLMDEGAVNLLYSVNQDESPSKKKAVISLDRAQRDLLNRTKAVKDVITQNSSQEDFTITLRKKDGAGSVPLFQTPPRKKSRDSIRSSIQSPPPSPSYIYPHRAEASRIIRRHSSSFSSDCSSPRRLSIDTQQQQQQQQNLSAQETSSPSKPTEPSKDPLDVPGPSRVLRKKGVPIFTRKPEEKTYRGKGRNLAPVDKKDSDTKDVGSERVPQTKSDVQKTEPQKSTEPTKSESQQKVESSKPEPTKLTLAEKRKLNTEMSKNFSKQLPKKRTRRSRNLEEEAAEQEAENAAKQAKKVEEETKKTEVEVVKPEVKKDKIGSRHVTLNTSYKELSLRKVDNLVQIILTPTSTKLKSVLNLQVFKELCEVLSHLSKDDTCRVVLMTSTDSSFCHGVDFSTLVQTTAEKRTAVAQEMVKALKSFLESLASFPKPMVAGVQGSAVGLGVTMLPLFDLVLASDKATFSTPYGRLGQVPEGIAFLTLPTLLGNTLTSELLYANRKLTASEALHHGLVTRILWPDKFQEELISHAMTIAQQSSQCMMATKSLLRQPLLSKLKDALETESKLLVQHWTSAECQQNFKKLLQQEEWW